MPSSVSIGNQSYTRVSYAYEAANEVLSPFDLDPSYLASLGANFGPAELDLMFFYGLERQATLTGIMRTGSIGYNFDAALVPHRARISCLAAAATAVVGEWRFWTENAYTWDAGLATGSAIWDFGGAGKVYFYPEKAFSENPITDIPPYITRDRIGSTIGLSWARDFSGLGFVSFAEAVWTWLPNIPVSAPLPVFSRAIAFSLALSRLLDNLDLSFSGMISLTDWSAALRPAVSVKFGADKELELAFPIFLGKADSQLGVYAGKYFAVFGFSYNF